MSETETTPKISPEMKARAVREAKDKARAGMWDLNIAIFLFTVLIIIIFLLFQQIGIEIVGPVAIFGLAMVWLVGWKRQRQLYERFYKERLEEIEQELEAEIKGTIEEVIDETIEEKVQKALRQRWE
jgi:predicted membrane chloride channel (bestrophin family)